MDSLSKMRTAQEGLSIEMARVLSVNVGLPRAIGKFRGKEIRSGILKRPVDGPVNVGRLNLEGDRQADLTVHGGVKKAVYVYPSEHYRFWKQSFPAMEMPWGTFGENLTTEGLLEDEVHIGDRFAIGTAEFAATQPRFPCFKLGLRFETNAVIRSFLESERSGFYMEVLKEGRLEAGDVIGRVSMEDGGETITSIVRAVKREG